MMKDVMTGTYIRGEENIKFVFKTYLTTSEKAKFVSSVTNVLIEDNYLSVLRNLFFDYYIVAMFTDVDMNIDFDDESIDVIDEIENFLDETNIVDIVRANLDDELINELNEAIDVNIEYRTGIHRNILNDALVGLINTLERKLDNFDMGNAMKMVEAFGGITGDFTPENIVDAYMKTDIAKQNVKELNKAKKKRAKAADEMAKVIDIANKK